MVKNLGTGGLCHFEYEVFTPSNETQFLLTHGMMVVVVVATVITPQNTSTLVTEEALIGIIIMRHKHKPPPPSSPPAHNHPNHYHPNHHHHHHHNHLHSSVDPLEGGESSDSSNQPFGYTRERFQKTVECVRQVPVHRQNPDEAAGLPYHFQASGSQPPYRSLQRNNNSRKVPPSHSFYSPRDSLSASGSGHYPAHYCRSKLHFTNSKGHSREGPQEESHTSMSSSGRGSILGRSHYPDVGGRASIKVDTLPDSYSSGLGSRSTSHSVPSSSCGQLRAGPPMEITSASSLTLPHEYDVKY